MIVCDLDLALDVVQEVLGDLLKLPQQILGLIFRHVEKMHVSKHLDLFAFFRTGESMARVRMLQDAEARLSLMLKCDQNLFRVSGIGWFEPDIRG